MSKQPPTGNRSITDWFRPKAGATQRSQSTPQRGQSPAVGREDSVQQQDEPFPKRQRTSTEGRWLSPSPTPSPSTLVASSAEQPKSTAGQPSDANLSFMSMRSTSSKRITVSSGQEVVRGSDTETDDDLEDLDTILNMNKNKPKPTVAFSRSNEARSTNIKPREQEQKKYTFSLSRLVEDKMRQTAMEVRIAEAQANLHEASAEVVDIHGTPKKEAIKAVLVEGQNTEDGGGKARRVMDALERTEAFERNDVWRFFETTPVKAPRNPFPRVACANAMLTTTLNDPQRRQHAFASGFIQRIAEKVPLPEELLSWLMLEVCRESKDGLLAAYIETLSQAAESTSPCLSEESLMRCFRALGARSEALDFNGPVAHSREKLAATYTHSTKQNLIPFVELLQKLAINLPSESRDLVVHFLIRASFDQTVLSSAIIRIQIEKCLKDILETYPEGLDLDSALPRLARSVFASVTSPSLRQQLLAALPASSFRTHHFRRMIAVAFALDKARHLDAPLHNPALTARMLLLFETGSPLRVTPETDYVELRARMGMLDVALDAGFDDFAFLEDGDKQAEKQFNGSVDRLTNAVRDLTARIVDAGAAHMSRTEAKVLAERVAQRWEFAVRTREKPPRDWFGEVEKEEGKGFMKGWIKGKEEDEEKKPQEIEEAPNEKEVEDVADEVDRQAKLQIETEIKQSGAPSEPGEALDERVEKATEARASSTTASVATASERKVPIRSSTVSPIAKKGKNRMLMMRF